MKTRRVRVKRGGADLHPFAPHQSTTWVHDAHCAGTDTEAFFDSSAWDELGWLCLACPARQHCLDWALAAERGLPPESRYGLYAATTPEERAAMDPTAPSPKKIRRTR